MERKIVSASDAGSKSSAESMAIRRSDRVFIVGATGTGKTTLVRTLLAPLPWVVVLDPKHQFDRSRSRSGSKVSGQSLITSRITEAAKHDEPSQIIYRPSLTECKAGCDEFWDWIWQRENTIVYVDEVFAVAAGANIPTNYGRCIQMGRSKNIGVWSCTQRPARIPANLLTEAEHFFMFETRGPMDLKRIAEYTDPIVALDRATGHDFWYYGVRDRNPIKTNMKNLIVKKRKL